MGNTHVDGCQGCAPVRSGADNGVTGGGGNTIGGKITLFAVVVLANDTVVPPFAKRTSVRWRRRRRDEITNALAGCSSMQLDSDGCLL